MRRSARPDRRVAQSHIRSRYPIFMAAGDFKRGMANSISLSLKRNDGRPDL